MTLPKNAVQHEDCSLDKLHKFVTDRKIPFKSTHAQNHTRKSHSKEERREKRKLIRALRRSDAAATFRFMELTLELRERVYAYILAGATDSKELFSHEIRERLQFLDRCLDRWIRAWTVKSDGF